MMAGMKVTVVWFGLELNEKGDDRVVVIYHRGLEVVHQFGSGFINEGRFVPLRIFLFLTKQGV